MSAPKNPFVGLRPFETDDSVLFFGRDPQTEELLQRLHRTRFVAVVGSSGCGKSSLVRAGLIPALEAGFLVADRDAWAVAAMKPGAHPVQHLASALENISQTLTSEGHASPQTADSTSPSPGSWTDGMASAIESHGADAVIDHFVPLLREGHHNVLLLVDQFEELFRFASHSRDVARKEEAAGFVGALLALAGQRALPFYVVLTMRSEFLGSCDAFHGLPEALNRSLYLVPRLTRRQRQEAIEGPMRLMGGSIAPRLLDRMLNEPSAVNDSDRLDDEGDHLPVLQHAMMRTWEQYQPHCASGQPVDIEDYRSAGTTRGALEQDADAALKGGDEELTRRLFQALTDTDAANRQIRRPARLSELEAITGARTETILAELNRFRLEGRCFLVWSDKEADPLIDISHESLIRRWSRLRHWVRQEADSAEQYRRLARAAERHTRHEEALWTDPQLQLAVAWRQRQIPRAAWATRHLRGVDFDQAIQFLADSEAAALQKKKCEDDQLQRAADQERELLFSNWRARRNQLLAGAAMVVMLALAVVVVVVVAKIQAQQRVMTQDALARQSLEIRDVSPQQSVLLAVEAIKTQAPLKAGENALRAALVGLGGRGLGGHTGEISGMALSRSGRWLVTASIDGTTRRWDLFSPTPEQTSMILSDGVQRSKVANPRLPGVRAVAITPDEKVVAIGKEDGGVAIVGLGQAAGQGAVVLSGHRASISALAVTEDGCWLVSGSEDGVIRLWDLRRLQAPSAHSVVTETEHRSPISVIRIDPEARWLVTGDVDGELRLWSLAGAVRTPVWRRSHVSVAEIGGTAPYLITGGRDGSARLWSLGEGGIAKDQVRIGELLFGPSNETSGSQPSPSSEDVAITSVAFSRKAEHDLVAIAQAGGAVHMLSLEETTRRQTVVADQGRIAKQQLRFSPDGRWLAIVRSGAPIHLVKNPGDELAEHVDLRGHDDSIQDLAFTPDSRRLVSGGSDGTVRLWDLLAPDPASEAIVLRGGRTSVSVVAFSSAGHWLFEGHNTGAGQLWDLKRPNFFWSTRATDGDPLIGAEVSRDERWVAIRTKGKLGELWAVREPGAPQLQIHEPSISALDISADSQWFVAGTTDGGVKAWRLDGSGPDNRLIKRHVWARREVENVAAGKNLFAAVAKDSMVRLWRWDGGTLTELDLPGRVDVPVGMNISSDDRWLTVVRSDPEGRNHDIRLWDLNAPRSSPRILEARKVTAHEISSDGRWLIAGTADGTVRSFDLTGRETRPSRVWGGHQGPILTVVMSPDNRRFATGGMDGTVRLRDLEDLAGDPAIFPGCKGGVASALFLDDGHLMTASVTGTVRRWRLTSAGLLDDARMAAGRNLSDQEWQKYFPTGIACRSTFVDLPSRCTDRSPSHDLPVTQLRDRWALR